MGESFMMSGGIPFWEEENVAGDPQVVAFSGAASGWNRQQNGPGNHDAGLAKKDHQVATTVITDGSKFPVPNTSLGWFSSGPRQFNLPTYTVCHPKTYDEAKFQQKVLESTQQHQKQHYEFEARKNNGDNNDDDYDDDDENSGSNRRNGGSATRDRKNTKNAEACKRHREKRKREEIRLRQKHEDLLSEREMLISRIADLQSECQTLRDTGTYDLEKENLLLREEIKKHKQFIYDIVHATQLVPKITPEEQYRLVKSGMDSATGNVLGLLYSSSCDDSWVSGQDLFLEDGSRVGVKFQMLPLGAVDKYGVKRINVKLSLEGIPFNAKQISDSLWGTVTEIEVMNQLHALKTEKDGVKRSIERMLPRELEDIAQKMEDRVQIVRYVETPLKDPQANKREAVFVMTNKTCEIHPNAFSGDVNGVDYERKVDSPLEETHIVTYSTTHTEKAFAPDFVPQHVDLDHDRPSKRISGTVVMADILRKGKHDGETTLTQIFSYPIGNCDDSFVGISHDDEMIITSDGVMSERAKAEFLAYIYFLKAGCNPAKYKLVDYRKGKAV